MVFKKMLMGFIAILAIVGLVTFAEQKLNAENDSEGQISKKLDDVLKNQKAIMQDIALLKQELNIVKIRVTQQQ